MEGLAHVSEVQRDNRVKLDKVFQVGEAVRTRVIKIDPTERKIGLTMRDVEPLTDEEKAEFSGGAAETPADTHAETPAETDEPPETNPEQG